MDGEGKKIRKKCFKYLVNGEQWWRKVISLFFINRYRIVGLEDCQASARVIFSMGKKEFPQDKLPK